MRLTIITPRLRRGSRVCVCDCDGKTHVEMVFRQKCGLIAAICRNTFVFMCVVVLETAASAIYSLFACNTPHSFVCDYSARVLRRILPCEIAALVYYAVFFRVRLLLLVASNLAHW